MNEILKKTTETLESSSPIGNFQMELRSGERGDDGNLLEMDRARSKDRGRSRRYSRRRGRGEGGGGELRAQVAVTQEAISINLLHSQLKRTLLWHSSSYLFFLFFFFYFFMPLIYQIA